MDSVALFMLIWTVLLGLVLGSFLNVLIFRYGTKEGIGGRSHCRTCRHPLSSWDLVPVFSYLLLRGRCRYCAAAISPQYPLVECSMGILSAGVFLAHPQGVAYVLGLFMWMGLLFLFVYDLKSLILPFPALIVTGALGLLSLFLSCAGAYCEGTLPGILSIAAGPILALPLLALSAVSRGRWMGWGDGLLELGLGWLLGMTEGLSALVIGFWSGAIVGLLLIALSHKRMSTLVPASTAQGGASGFTMKSELPFAPFLILGAAVAYFFHVDLFSALFSL
ncbi:MAG: prepilin peptidase [Patescibacteria group bacterium]|nr:prepilin peptidase [Patescibacteria group bacterium]